MILFSNPLKWRLIRPGTLLLNIKASLVRLFPVIFLVYGCTHLSKISLPQDPAAAQLYTKINKINTGLEQFKCVAKITIAEPGLPVQFYRSAIAGRLDDHIRIDLFAPFGGAASTMAADGKYLYFVVHASRKYYKKRYNDGSLNRFVKMDLTVGDLLALLVGRVPLGSGLSPHGMPVDDAGHDGLLLVDQWGQTRQQITLDADGRPSQARWFSGGGRQTLALTITGKLTIDGFIIPKLINLCADDGYTVSIRFISYEANTILDEDLFVPPPISS